MTERITEEAVRHVALLSRLEITEQEVHRFAAELDEILEYAAKLNVLDTENVEPAPHALRQTNIFREDVVRPSLNNEAALANAPEAESGHFKTPPIIQEM